MNPTFRVTVDDRWPQLTVRGVLDVQARGPLARRLLDLEATGAEVLHLDVGGVVHVDSSCLRLFDEALRRVEARGARLRLTSASLCFAFMSRVAGFHDLADEADQAFDVAPVGGPPPRSPAPPAPDGVQNAP